MSKKPIPSIPKSSIGTDRRAFDEAIKENLEVITAQRVAEIKKLDPATATTADIISKINELIDRLQ